MDYLVGLLLVGMTVVVFLRIVSVLENGTGARTTGAALRELLFGHRATK